MAGKTAIVPNMILRDLYRHGPIKSITGWAIRHDVDRVYAWQVFCELEQEGLIEIKRNGRHPAEASANPTYQPAQPSGMCYQLALWS